MVGAKLCACSGSHVITTDSSPRQLVEELQACVRFIDQWYWGEAVCVVRLLWPHCMACHALLPHTYVPLCLQSKGELLHHLAGS